MSKPTHVRPMAATRFLGPVERFANVDHRRLSLRFLAWAAFIWTVASPAITLLADSVVIPAEYSEVQGPALMGEFQDFSFRNFYLYYNFEFPSGPVDITGFRYRPKSSTGTYSVEYRDTQISLTTTREKSLLPDFESNLHAALQPPTVVMDGDIIVQTTRERPPLNPKNFDYEFRWNTPFRYDPADGVNLLIDFNSRGGYDRSPLLDAANNGTFAHEGELLQRHLVEFQDVYDYWPNFPITEFLFTPVADPRQFGDWGAPTSVESTPGTSPDFNTEFNEGCPYQSPDGLSFYMASNRPGGVGGIDIWVAQRNSPEDPFGAPVNLPSPINSTADDFCPTRVADNGLYFVSTRDGGYGGADIYFSREEEGAWSAPKNLGPEINSPAGEASPAYFEDEMGNSYLYFSSNRDGGFEPGGTDSDIYFSKNSEPAQLAPGLNSSADDFRPNVRKDGQEIVFDSNRGGGLGGFDIWMASRRETSDDWQTPLNVMAVNSEANETRASLSWDGASLVFGSNRPGSEGQADIYLAIRDKLESDLHVGDLDRDGALTAADIDALTVGVINQTNLARLDLNEDAKIDLRDHGYWVTELKRTWYGDVNLDGVFDSGDLVEVFATGKYERDLDAGWAEGDWTGDRRFDSGDLVAAFADGGYEKGARFGVLAVPEPNGMGVMVLCAAAWVSSRQRKATATFTNESTKDVM